MTPEVLLAQQRWEGLVAMLQPPTMMMPGGAMPFPFDPNAR